MARPRIAATDESQPVSPTSIQSVERAVALLRLFLPNVPSLGPTDLAQLSGMSVSTAHRYCSALRKAGLLRYDPATGRYGLGGGCIELGRAAAESLPVVDLARPLMQELVSHVDRAVVLGVWDEESVRVVEVNDHTSATGRVTVRVGAQLPVFDSAQGLVFLAFSPRLRQRFSRRPEMDKLTAKFEAAQQDGCAILDSFSGPMSIPGVTTVAVPVFLGESIAATMAVIGSTESMPRSPDAPAVVFLKEAAAELSYQLTA
jgi:DNA-binding IclR family transcriptional regulator